MTVEANDNIESRLQAAGVQDIERGVQALVSLAGNGVADEQAERLVPALLEALGGSPDPDRSLSNFAHWFSALPSPVSHLAHLIGSPESLARFCTVTGCSQYFADLVTRNPEYFEVIAEASVQRTPCSAARFYRQLTFLVAACRQPELKQEALRRWKAREMLRIGVRDLCGLAEMAVCAREFAHLAGACVQAALDIALESLRLEAGELTPSFAVIAMGKLGGLELNYSSDIDLMFVHDNELPARLTLEDGRAMEGGVYVTRLAEALIRILAEETANGAVFRVDMRLRPEGRFGAITRSLGAFDAYYESWAESWEFQALLKARFVAGDRNLGHALEALISTYVYRKYEPAGIVQDIVRNKRAIEQKCEIEGETETNIKTGYGGIRDVEFLVQSLQLKHGFSHRRIRTPNTLSAIQRLCRANLLGEGEAGQLAAGYTLLRNIEHRLQLLHGMQVQNLPKRTNVMERAKVARAMGYASVETFEPYLSTCRGQIRGILNRLFYSSAGAQTAPEEASNLANLDALLDNLTSAAARAQLTHILTSCGFKEITAALRTLQISMHGNEFGDMPPDTPVEFKRIAPQLIARAAGSANPDAALAGIESLSLAVPNRAQLYASFYESPDLLDRLVGLGACSPPLLSRLASHLEWMEVLLGPDFNLSESDSDAIPGMAKERLLAEMRSRLSRARSAPEVIDAISAVFQREALLIGAREIWEDTNSGAAMAGLTELADATVQVLIESCSRELITQSALPDTAAMVLQTVAFVGLGKLGGAELGYASDWDLMAVYEAGPGDSTSARVAEAIVTQIMASAQELIMRGAHIEIDLRLRPWGRGGALALTPRGYAEYYRTSAETWERQAALKARFVAGNARTGRRLIRLMRAISFGRGLSEAEDLEVRAMKQRIELERLKPGETLTDVKLGHGGLTDIEWIAQRLQMKYGRQYPSLREPNTIVAVSELAACRLLDNAEADLLIAGYNLLVRFRNALWLQLGRSQDTIPDEPVLLQTLARQLGYFGVESDSAADRMVRDIANHMREVRAIFHHRFLKDS